MAEQYPQLSNDFETSTTWIYPINVQVRKYQQDICRAALFANTLVCLPTGLGKTLIAAVVMYNYWRWFPTGIIVFMAPTKPLVAQQLKACYEIMGIPETETAHLDGEMKQDKRALLWQSKRVFFCTAQTFHNDLEEEVCDPRRVVCVVVDEAHKANTTGFAYAKVVGILSSYSNHFRILALSATPGSDARAIQHVIKHLKIEHIEARSEDDAELAPYVHDKQVEIVMAEKGCESITQTLKKELNDVMSSSVNFLVTASVLSSNNTATMNVIVINGARKEVERLKDDPFNPLSAEDARACHEAIDELEAILKAKKILAESGAIDLVLHLEGLQAKSMQLPPAFRSTVQGQKFAKCLMLARKVLPPLLYTITYTSIPPLTCPSSTGHIYLKPSV